MRGIAKKEVPCKVCGVIGKQLRVDYLEGQCFPPQVKEFLPVTGTDGEVSRCPLCGQAFYYEHNWDNDVYNLMDYGVLYRFDEKSLEEKIKHIAQR